MPGLGEAVVDRYGGHSIDFELHTKVVRKTADETVNNSTTLQNDDELLFAIGANEVWHVLALLMQISGTTPDFKAGFTVPSGGTFLGRRSADGTGNLDSGDAGVLAGSARNVICMIEGIAINGSTAGNLQLQWAQNVQDASDTKVLTNSCLIATQLV